MRPETLKNNYCFPVMYVNILCHLQVLDRQSWKVKLFTQVLEQLCADSFLYGLSDLAFYHFLNIFSIYYFKNGCFSTYAYIYSTRCCDNIKSLCYLFNDFIFCLSVVRAGKYVTAQKLMTAVSSFPCTRLPLSSFCINLTLDIEYLPYI